MPAVAATTGADVVSNLANLLPTGTFLAFQTLAPLFTNNGECARVEKVVTSVLIALFDVISFALNFTDSITTTGGKVYYGIVTTRGLFSPQFPAAGLAGVDGMFYNDSSGKYVVTVFDFINGALNVVIFNAIAMLTSPVTTCFYPRLSSTLVKTIPLLVGIVVAMYFSFAPHARNGVGFAMFGSSSTLVQDHHLAAAAQEPKSSLKKTGGDQELLLGTKAGGKDAESKDLLLQVKNARGNPFFEPNVSPTPTPAASPLYRSPNRAGAPASSPIDRV